MAGEGLRLYDPQTGKFFPTPDELLRQATL